MSGVKTLHPDSSCGCRVVMEDADDWGGYMLVSDHKAALVEELRALAKEMCFRCEMHDDAEPEVESADTEYVHWRAGVEDAIPCHASKIHARIAAIEEEG